ncbi:MAG: sensor histidine kinase [bacterium]|nr:sensor histidine kinase [bacterium]
MGSGAIVVPARGGPLHVAHDFLSQPAQQNHIVQFYEDEAFLAEVVAHFVGVGLGAGEPTIVIATESHRAAFNRRLEVKGFDVARLQASGQLVVLDARATLARFMVDGHPDAARFRSVVGGALAELGRHGCHARIRAYGEMVDMLWADGNADAAIRLEELWNDLASEHSFSLLCAYDMARFPAGADGNGLARVCGTHSHVIPTERYAQLVDADARMREVAQLQQRARALEVEIAERKKVEERLRDSLRQRDDFLAIAGHELKTPLTAAQLMMESLLRLTRIGVPGTVHERLAKAAHSLDRLGKLIDGLLDVTRLTTGRMALHVDEIDLAALVREVVEAASPMLRNARCSVDIDSDKNVVGRWDRQRLEQIVMNLLSNAAKYSSGQPIEIRVERGDERARLVVRDRGAGIAPADRARIFERFERADDSASTWGLGLGLWIARQAVESHGGTIAVDSELGKGATFIVELPYRR